jgi:hypothetical protein
MSERSPNRLKSSKSAHKKTIEEKPWYTKPAAYGSLIAALGLGGCTHGCTQFYFNTTIKEVIPRINRVNNGVTSLNTEIEALKTDKILEDPTKYALEMESLSQSLNQNSPIPILENFNAGLFYDELAAVDRAIAVIKSLNLEEAGSAKSDMSIVEKKTAEYIKTNGSEPSEKENIRQMMAAERVAELKQLKTAAKNLQVALSSYKEAVIVVSETNHIQSWVSGLYMETLPYPPDELRDDFNNAFDIRKRLKRGSVSAEVMIFQNLLVKYGALSEATAKGNKNVDAKFAKESDEAFQRLCRVLYSADSITNSSNSDERVESIISEWDPEDIMILEGILARGGYIKYTDRNGKYDKDMAISIRLFFLYLKEQKFNVRLFEKWYKNEPAAE